MPSLTEIKQRICSEAESIKSEIIGVSHDIHSHPEEGLREFFASAKLADLLAAHGFSIKRGIGGLETAFRADYPDRGEGPRIAILAEYDALRGLGHGCGHNIIAAAAYGAAAVLKDALDTLGGSVAVIGTPAEETAGGKINLLDAGVFDGCDFAMMIHPANGKSIVGRGALACTGVTVEFTGKSAHSAAEELGINALTACICTFNNISAIRPSFKPGQKVNGVILDGGTAGNVVPGYARAEFCVRAKTVHELIPLAERITQCAGAGADAVGAKAVCSRDPLFCERYSNHVMDELFRKNLAFLGEIAHYPEPGEFEGSSDIGNVSMKLPTIHEYISIAPGKVNMHSAELREAAVSERGDRACMLGAKALAMTACDLLAEEKTRREAADEFVKTVPESM